MFHLTLQRLRQIKRQQQIQQPPAASLPPAPAAPTTDHLQERLKRLQELANLGGSSSKLAGNKLPSGGSLRPILPSNALPSRSNNSNVGTLDLIMASHAPADKKQPAAKKQKTMSSVTVIGLGGTQLFVV